MLLRLQLLMMRRHLFPVPWPVRADREDGGDDFVTGEGVPEEPNPLPVHGDDVHYH